MRAMITFRSVLLSNMFVPIDYTTYISRDKELSHALTSPYLNPN